MLFIFSQLLQKVMLSIQPKNIFEAILKYGHDEDFNPTEEACEQFLPTSAPAGSEEKVEVLKLRVMMGLPLWHDDDRVDYAGITSTTAPKRTNSESRTHRDTRKISNSTTAMHYKVDEETPFSNMTETGIDPELIKQYQAANELEAIKDREELGDLPEESLDLAHLFANVVAAQKTSLEENQNTALNSSPSQLNDDKFYQVDFSANLRESGNTSNESEAEIDLVNQSNSLTEIEDSNREDELVSAGISSYANGSQSLRTSTSSQEILKVGSSTLSRDGDRMSGRTRQHRTYRSASLKYSEKPRVSQEVQDHVRLEPSTIFDDKKSAEYFAYAAKMEAKMAQYKAEGKLL
jgi:hypothetical protein